MQHDIHLRLYICSKPDKSGIAVLFDSALCAASNCYLNLFFSNLEDAGFETHLGRSYRDLLVPQWTRPGISKSHQILDEYVRNRIHSQSGIFSRLD